MSTEVKVLNSARNRDGPGQPKGDPLDSLADGNDHMSSGSNDASAGTASSPKNTRSIQQKIIIKEDGSLDLSGDSKGNSPASEKELTQNDDGDATVVID